MKTLEIHEKLKSIPSAELAKVIGTGVDMAKKYRINPFVHTPDAIQAEKIKRKFKIPNSFWLEVKSLSHKNSIAK